MREYEKKSEAGSLGWLFLVSMAAHIAEYQDYAVIELLNLRDRIGNLEAVPYEEPDFFDSDAYVDLQTILHTYVNERGNRSLQGEPSRNAPARPHGTRATRQNRHEDRKRK